MRILVQLVTRPFVSGRNFPQPFCVMSLVEPPSSCAHRAMPVNIIVSRLGMAAFSFSWPVCPQPYTMVKRCVAYGCANTHKKGFSLFSFPKDPKRRLLWQRQVRLTRADFSVTDSSTLCSAHFLEEMFDPSYLMMARQGFKTVAKLKEDAV